MSVLGRPDQRPLGPIQYNTSFLIWMQPVPAGIKNIRIAGPPSSIEILLPNGPRGRSSFNTLAKGTVQRACSAYTANMWWQTLIRCARLVFVACFAGLSLGGQLAQAQDLFSAWQHALERSRLVEISQNHLLSRQMLNVSMGGFELAGGQRVGFDRWYKTSLQDTRVSWMTPIAPDWGVIWGVSTGERGTKYTIDPSMKIGLVFNSPIDRRSRLSVKVSTVLGGRLQEKPCTADYGAIGGVQSVNCRLAASEMAPAQTLSYLFNSLPPDLHQLTFSYQKSF